MFIVILPKNANATSVFLKANIIMSFLYIQITVKITVPMKTIFNNDFNNSTEALIENIFFAPWIGSIFFKSNFNDSVENKKPICIRLDRKSTRLNSSHVSISYAVFCLKKNKQSKS